jgi:hypothetical protein
MTCTSIFEGFSCIQRGVGTEFGKKFTNEREINTLRVK